MARTLKFNIAGQSIEQDPNCDFSGLVPGTEGYLKVEFTFSPEWDGCVKAAVFNIGAPGGEYAAVLKDGKSCDIPDAVCGRPAFKVNLTTRGVIVEHLIASGRRCCRLAIYTC